MPRILKKSVLSCRQQCQPSSFFLCEYIFLAPTLFQDGVKKWCIDWLNLSTLYRPKFHTVVAVMTCITCQEPGTNGGRRRTLLLPTSCKLIHVLCSQKSDPRSRTVFVLFNFPKWTWVNESSIVCILRKEIEFNVDNRRKFVAGLRGFFGFRNLY